jgi:hypothetical protein
MVMPMVFKNETTARKKMALRLAAGILPPGASV